MDNSKDSDMKKVLQRCSDLKELSYGCIGYLNNTVLILQYSCSTMLLYNTVNIKNCTFTTM